MPANLPPARLLNASWFAWLLLALPGAVLTYGYSRGTTFYGEYLHATGELGVRLLMLAMAVTPFKILFPSAAWVRWLARRRRYIGVAAFGYSLLHAGAYLERQPLDTIIKEAGELALAAGWISFAVMLVLASTSNDAAVRSLRTRWKWLHRTVYLAAALTFAHWVLTAFDPTAAYVHLGILAALQALRLLRYRVRAAEAPPSDARESPRRDRRL